MKKSISLLLAVLFVSLAFTSCGSKTAPTYEAFIEHAVKAEYEVDAEEFDDANGQGAIAYKDETNIMFLQYESNSEALQSFSELSQVIEDLETGSGTTTSSSGSTWGNRSLTTNGVFYRVSYIDSTVIAVESSADDKKEVNAFLKEIGF